jgi:hypothetical protein
MHESNRLSKMKERANSVLFKAYDDYSTNLPLEACDDDDVLLAHTGNAPLSRRNTGGPCMSLCRNAMDGRERSGLKRSRSQTGTRRGFGKSAAIPIPRCHGRTIGTVETFTSSSSRLDLR